MKQRSGLGRGLAALLPTADTQLRWVDIDLIVPNPRQPRTKFDPDQLAELADSIREHGVLQPLIVSEQAADRAPGRPATYQIIAGERRWQSARIAGLERVPVVVKEATDEQALAWALVENIQRADLGPLEEAVAFRQLVEEFGLTQDAVADRVGRSRPAVANILRLLRLPDSVKALVASGELSEGHARALLSADSADRLIALARRAIDEGWTVRRTEEEARRPSPMPAIAPALPDDAPEWRSIEGRLRESLGTRVDLARSRRGGRVVIHFHSNDELEAVLARLGIDDR